MKAPAVYALAADVDVFRGRQVGRLVWRFNVPDGLAIDFKRTLYALEQQFLKPHRDYWIGRSKPAYVRIEYAANDFSQQVYSWSKNRVSWTDCYPLHPVGRIVNGQLFLVNEEAHARFLLLQPASSLLLSQSAGGPDARQGHPASNRNGAEGRDPESERARQAEGSA